MGQQLTMTPQLQQAIRLLQLSTLDLQQEIQEALDSNPMLEREEDGDDFSHADPMAEAADQNGEGPSASQTSSDNRFTKNPSITPTTWKKATRGERIP